MKTRLLAIFAVAALLLPAYSGLAQEKSDAAAELKALVSKVQAKLREHKTSEADLAGELKQFDTLLAEHQGEKTDPVARILFMKAMLYEQVIKNKSKADELLDQLKRDFPDSQAVKMVKQQEEVKKIQANLVPGSKFPDFNETDVAGKPLSIAKYKGKVVLVDFWATWCGPCVGELPNVLKTYEKHHAKGFEIVGISLDQSQNKLTKFTADKKMPWQQFFDGKGWGNKLAVKYGIQSIPATFLLDGQGKIIAKNLRGEALEEAVSRALAKN